MCPSLSDPRTPICHARGEGRGKVLMTRAVATMFGAHIECPAARASALRLPRGSGAPGPLLTAGAMPYLSPNTVWIAWYILESLLYLVDIRNF